MPDESRNVFEGHSLGLELAHHVERFAVLPQHDQHNEDEQPCAHRDIQH